MAIFKANGFVVSERLGSPTFGDAYYRIFNGDLPVFITADSILHAWHKSYQALLEELEELQLSTLLEGMLSNMSVELPGIWQKYGAGPIAFSIRDADQFLTVARTLWEGKRMPTMLGIGVVEEQVSYILDAINSLGTQRVYLLGSFRTVDFSQFQPRGHYVASKRLQRYFQAMMWCGQVDMRFMTYAPNKENDIRQLGTAIVICQLLKNSAQLANWDNLERVTRAFAGPTDSMTVAQFSDLLHITDIMSLDDVPTSLVLTNLHNRLITGESGVQSINAAFLYKPFGADQLKLPRSFTLCGQKFTLDSWALSQMVFDRVWRNPMGNEEQVMRRRPSGLDVAFSVFGNEAAVPILVERIEATNGTPFRDGLPYHQNLLAVKRVMDRQASDVWTNNIYNAWLGAIRSLSASTTESAYPGAMRTRAWGAKTLNTQLGAWTELRHDTLLYLKQSVTDPIACSYPEGFVEPRPGFWRQMKILSETAAAAINALALAGEVTIPSRDSAQSTPVTYNLEVLKLNQIAFLKNFTTQMAILEEISQQELSQRPLSQDQTEFLKNTIERYLDYFGYRHWNGWYPSLYYRNAFAGRDAPLEPAYETPGCDQWDPLIADVHTDFPDQIVGDPGAVIHEAVGNVDLLMIAIDNGPDRGVYAGPVMSHFEIEVPGVARLNDEGWKSLLQSDPMPSRPDWTRSYLVPGPFTMPPKYP